MRSIKVISLILLLASTAIAQDTVFHLTLGSIGDDEAVRIFSTDQGFVLFGSTGEVGNGESDIYIAQLSKDLTEVEFSTLGTGGMERLIDVDTMGGKYYLLSQIYDGFGNGYGWRLDQLDDELNELDSFIYNPTDWVEPLSISKGDSGIVVLYEFINGAQTPHLKRLDPDLNELGTIDLIEDSLLVDQQYSDVLIDSGVIMVLSDAFVDAEDRQVFLEGMDVEGAPLFLYSFGDSLIETSNEVVRVSDTSFAITGSSNSRFGTEYDAYVVHFYEDGTEIWERKLGYNPNANNRDEVGCQTLRRWNNDFTIGLTTATYGQGGTDFHVYGLSPVGTFVFGNSFGLSSDETMESMLFDQDSSVVMFGTRDVGEVGLADLFVVKAKVLQSGPEKAFSVLQDTTTGSQLQVGIERVYRFSNCTDFTISQGQIQVKNSIALTLFDMQGREVAMSTTGSLLTEGFQTGVYLFRVDLQSGETCFQKIFLN